MGIRRTHSRLKPSGPHGLYDSDNSVKDPLFKINKADLHSSDSEIDRKPTQKLKIQHNTKNNKTNKILKTKPKTQIHINQTSATKPQTTTKFKSNKTSIHKTKTKNQILRKVSRNLVRGKDWKKRATTLNRNISNTPGRPKVSSGAEKEKAKKKLFTSPRKES